MTNKHKLMNTLQERVVGRRTKTRTGDKITRREKSGNNPLHPVDYQNSLKGAKGKERKDHGINNQNSDPARRKPNRHQRRRMGEAYQEANEMLGACIAEGLGLRSVVSKMKDRYQKGSKKAQAKGMEKANRESERFHADRKRRERGAAYSKDS